MSIIRATLGASAMEWFNMGINALNTGANMYAALSPKPTQTAFGETVHTTIVNERQLTPEEIDIIKQQHQEWLKNQQLERAMKMQQNADMRRVLQKEYKTPESDNTPIFIVGGLLLVGMIFMVIKKK